jgi:hypothetical protein
MFRKAGQTVQWLFSVAVLSDSRKSRYMFVAFSLNSQLRCVRWQGNALEVVGWAHKPLSLLSSTPPPHHLHSTLWRISKIPPTTKMFRKVVYGQAITSSDFVVKNSWRRRHVPCLPLETIAKNTRLLGNWIWGVAGVYKYSLLCTFFGLLLLRPCVAFQKSHRARQVHSSTRIWFSSFACEKLSNPKRVCHLWPIVQNYWWAWNMRVDLGRKIGF